VLGGPSYVGDRGGATLAWGGQAPPSTKVLLKKKKKIKKIKILTPILLFFLILTPPKLFFSIWPLQLWGAGSAPGGGPTQAKETVRDLQPKKKEKKRKKRKEKACSFFQA
jgi:hypothetical protein